MAKAPHIHPTDEDRQKVFRMAELGLSRKHMCFVMGIKDVDSLRKHYGEQLAKGAHRSHLELAEMAFKKAKDSPVLLKYLCQVHLGWRDDAPTPDAQDSEQEEVKKTDFVDAPPNETSEQWLQRRRKLIEAMHGGMESTAGTTGRRNSGDLVS